jgi:hypothetical protein
MGALRDRLAYEARLAGREDEARLHEQRAEQARAQARALGFVPRVVVPPPSPPVPAATTRTPPPEFRPVGPDPSIWNYHRFQPHPFLRRNTYLAWMQQPRFEGAMTHPTGRFVLRTSLDFAAADFSESADGGGPSNYNGRLLEQTVQLDYGLSDWLQVGGRLVSGQLRSANSDRMTLYQDGAQIIHRGDRGWNVESLTLRLKGAYPVQSDLHIGGLAELKIPLFASSRDYLTGRQVDLGISGQLSYYFQHPSSGDFATHLQAGVVFPIGDPRLFRNGEDGTPFLFFAAGLAWAPHDYFSVGVQVEGQTSPWNELDVLESPAITFSGFTKVQINRNIYLDFGAGFGLTDLSADFQGSLGLTFSY